MFFHSSTARRQCRSTSSNALGTIPAAVTALTASPAAASDPKKPTTVRSGSRAGRSFTVISVTTRECPRADHQAAEVIANHALRGPPAEPDDLATSDHHLQRQHVVPRNAVFDAADAAGVGRHVAAMVDQGELARVRRIPQVVSRAGAPQVVIDDPGLDDGEPLLGIDLQNSGHRFERQQDTAVDALAPPEIPVCPRRAVRPGFPRSAQIATTARTSSVDPARTTAAGTPEGAQTASSCRYLAMTPGSAVTRLSSTAARSESSKLMKPGMRDRPVREHRGRAKSTVTRWANARRAVRCGH